MRKTKLAARKVQARHVFTLYFSATLIKSADNQRSSRERLAAMAEALGFGMLSSDLVSAMALIALIASCLAGWITDALMQDNGFGVIGNSVLVFVGAIGGVVAWNRYINEVTYSPPLYVLSASAICAVTLLLGLAVIKRFT